jgi:hypothetical protein
MAPHPLPAVATIGNAVDGGALLPRTSRRREEMSMATLDKIDPPIVEPDKVQPQPPEGRGESPTITGDTARQGPAGSRVMVVLVTGIIGAIVLMAIAYSFFAHG